MSSTWSAGTTIILHEIWRGRVYSARPVVVAEDTGDRLALWCPRGTRWKVATTPPARERAPTRADRFVTLLERSDWVFQDATWRISNLTQVRPGDWHAVWAGWDEAGDPWGWYVNFQRPFVRTKQGIQTMDLALDIVVEPDAKWRWKDEDEFQVLVDAGVIDGTEAATVRREAENMSARIEANEAPFNEPWHDWRPDPAWPAPRLPDGWDR